MSRQRAAHPRVHGDHAQEQRITLRRYSWVQYMEAELYFRVFQRSWSTIWPPLRTRTNRLSFDAHRNCTRVAPVIPRSQSPLNLPPQLRERDPHHRRIRQTPLLHLASLSDHQWKKRTLFQRYERSSSTCDAKACNHINESLRPLQ